MIKAIDSKLDLADSSTYEQYVREVPGFSSQYGSNISISYTADNICGPPLMFPRCGDFHETFVMRTYGKWWIEAPSKNEKFMIQNERSIESQDFIDILYEQKVVPVRLNIYETYHPGSVVRIWAWKEVQSSHLKSCWVLLWEDKPQTCPNQSRIFSPPLKEVDFYTNLFRLEFNHSHLKYYAEIDAVSLHGLPHYMTSPSIPAIDVLPANANANMPVPEVFLDFLNTDFYLYSEEYDAMTRMQIYSKHIERPSLKDANAQNDGVFKDIPEEVILKMFSYLDLKSLSRCCQLNKHLRHIAMDSILYTELYIKPYWNLITSDALTNLVNRCGKGNLRKLDLSWCGSNLTIDDKKFSSFIRVCGSPLLTTLLLNCCPFVNDCVLFNVTSICSNLKEISLRNCVAINGVGYDALAKLNHLRRLDLYGAKITDSSLIKILTENPHLQHLNLGSCSRIVSLDNIAMTMSESNLNLVSVDFWKTYSLTPVGLQYLSKCHYLEEIDIGWCLGVNFPGECMLQVASGCKRLKKLFLGAVRNISDAELEPFLEHCPHLEQIDFLGNQCITPAFCYRMLSTCKKLRLLDLSFCSQFSSSTVDAWRMNFPKVDIKRSCQEGPGRAGFDRHF